jgi:hypothetical protein
MSQVKTARSFGSRQFAAGHAVGCYDCHDGPNP